MAAEAVYVIDVRDLMGPRRNRMRGGLRPAEVGGPGDLSTQEGSGRFNPFGQRVVAALTLSVTQRVVAASQESSGSFNPFSHTEGSGSFSGGQWQL